MNSASKLILTALVLTVLATAAAQAQVNNANITATATVQQPINVSTGQSLNFGNVFPGVAKTIATTDATAGRWDVTGQASTLVNLSLTLPINLQSGLNLLPIANFTGSYNTANNAAAATPFPVAGASTSLSGTGALFVWVGGQVNPASNQPAGVYTASVTLTVMY